MTTEANIKAEMLDFAAAAASDLGSSERNATKFGASMLTLAWVHGRDMDQMREETLARVKRWTSSAETGKEVKKKFVGWFSRLSKVNGCKDALTETERKRLLAGEMSFQSVYNALRKREKEADEREAEAAREAELAAAAAAAPAQSQSEGEAQEPAQQQDEIIVMARKLAQWLDETPLAGQSLDRLKALDELQDSIAEARGKLAAALEATRKAA